MSTSFGRIVPRCLMIGSGPAPHNDRLRPTASLTRRAFVGRTAAAVAATALSARRVYGANERVGVGVIGFGLIGKRHVVSYQQLPGANLVAVAETHRGRLDEAAAFIGGPVRAYRDFRELLDDRNVEAVVVAVPDHWHALMTMLA